jgi:hypothetical protein
VVGSLPGMADRMLGKKAGVVHDPRSFALAELLTADLPPVQREWRMAHNTHGWPMFANDRLGDCTCASFGGHRVIAQEASAQQKRTVAVSEQDVIALYSAVTGYRPDDPSTDQGAYLLDVLRYARSHGYGREADGTPHTIGAYAKVNLSTYTQMKQGARLFGGLYLGLALPVAAQHQDVWDVSTGPDAEPYSWGGHAVWMVGYDPKGITLVTWGSEQRATWAWVSRYVDEAWAVISEDFLRGSGRTPQGFDVGQLQQLLSRLA